MSVQKALASLKSGKAIILYDGDEREGEADIVFHASFAAPEKIEMLRKDAGGLICVAIGKEISERLHLPFFADLIDGSAISKMKCKKTAYGDKPAFSIPVNYKGVYTGITDNDRALTISKLSDMHNATAESFCENFYTPGHVFLLIGSGLQNRRGHTELSLELAKLSGLSPIMVLCEMLGKGKALSKQNAAKFAKKHGLEFVEGREVLEAQQ